MWYKLGVGLFQQSTPEFILLGRVHKYQSTIVGRQTIINNHVNPRAKPPELKVESTNISVRSGETLFWRYNTVEKVLKLTEAWHSCQKPAIPCNKTHQSGLEIHNRFVIILNVSSNTYRLKVIHMPSLGHATFEFIILCWVTHLTLSGSGVVLHWFLNLALATALPGFEKKW